MAKPPRSGVVYAGIELGGKPLVVERLHREYVNMGIAQAAVALMLPAYADVLEKPKGSLPPGTIVKRFNPNSKLRVRAQHGRMCSHMDKKGSRYWLLRDPERPDELIGLSKVSPRGTEEDTPFGYFNDVVVRPSDQGRGFGRVLAYTALKSGVAPLDQPLALEGYAGSETNSWFEGGDWKMVARGIDEKGVTFGSHSVPQIRYVTESGITTADILNNFEAHMPALATSSNTLP